MLRIVFLTVLLTIVNVACGQSNDPHGCIYAAKVKYHLPALDNASYLSEVKGVDRYGEETITYGIQFADGDQATLEQKFCEMYNFEVSYKIKKLNMKNFKNSLDNIEKLIRSVQQDYKLKHALRDIVEMTMNERNLSISSAFKYGLPLQSVNSSESVEHSISFSPRKDKEPFDAEVIFYFGLGGE